MSIDMDTTGNTATTLGPLNSCVQATPPTSIQFDLTATMIPPYLDGGTPDLSDDSGGIVGLFSKFYYKTSSGITSPFTSYSLNWLMASNTGSYIYDFSGGVDFAVLDTGIGAPESGSGVLMRVNLPVHDLAAGRYTIVLEEAGHFDVTGNLYEPDVVKLGYVAIGIPCDIDEDAIPDEQDACPTLPGSSSHNGCPPPSTPPAVGGSVGILDSSQPVAARPGESEVPTTSLALAVVGAAVLTGGAILHRRFVKWHSRV